MRCGLWWCLLILDHGLGEVPVQTEWQRQLFQQVNHTAHGISQQFHQQLLHRLDRADVRGLLASCCPELAQLPAEALAKELRTALLTAEVVSGFSSEINGSLFSFSLSEAEEVREYENLWEVWVRNDGEVATTHGAMDWLETSFFGFKAFKEHAHPKNKLEARERSAYFMLNSLRVDAGSPLFGDVSVVLKPSFAHATAIISPVDSGSWAGFCNGSYPTPRPSYVHNCSAFPGHQGLGTFHALDHLFGANEAYWTTPDAFLRPLERLLASDDASTALNGNDLVRYFEVLPVAQVTFADVKFVIADFPHLFGTKRGGRVRTWCQRNGWVLLWSLGLNVGFSTNYGYPHFWDVFNTGPFRTRPRLIDPEFLRTWMNISSFVLDVFNHSWRQFETRRTAARDREIPLQPIEFQAAWTALVSKLSDLQISPVRAHCHDLDLCIGVTSRGCLCKPEVQVRTESAII
eukprot:Skav212451  [mRNA]  locus=scaffold385:43035:44417:+ [translate_table: standard]